MLRFLPFLFLLTPILSFSQRPANGSGAPQKGITGAISGILIDSISQEAIAFASVGIIDRQSGKTVNGGISDEKGSFRIMGLPSGAYTLQVVFMGYKNKEVNTISLSPQKPDFDCGAITMAPETRLLDEIQIVGEAALIEARPDKIVYNAEKDVTSRGGDAADVLRNVPLLSVDFDGNVSLRGSENVRILINGRPSGIFNASVADALKMMPADQIKSVEVITAPSAKYDGEGTAGIINIITKKKNIEGLAGSVDMTAGTRSDRGNMNLNYGRGRLGINMSGGGHYSPPLEGSTSFRRQDFGGALPTFLTQDGTNTSSRLGYRLNLAAEYSINAFSTLNSGFSYRGHNVDNLNDVLSTYSIDTMVQELYRRTTDGYSNRGGWDWEMDYRRTFPKKDKEWSIAFELDKDDDHSESLYDLGYAYPLSQPDELENNEDFGDNIELTMQTDYTHPFNSAFKLESGLKATLRIIESDFSFSAYNADLNDWVVDPLRTDIFYYDQNVYAGYVNGNFNLGDDMTLIAGLRMEITELLGEFETFVSPFENTYTNLLPNVTLSKKVGEYNQVKISYNQRIQRPNQRHINPFIEYNDARDISYGNPTLGPELVQQIELGTNVFIKG
jgi:ferric enterobactin receptor